MGRFSLQNTALGIVFQETQAVICHNFTEQARQGGIRQRRGLSDPPPFFPPLFGRHPNIGLFSALADKSFCLVYFLNPKPGWNEGDRQGAPVWGRKAVAAREEERNFRSARTLKKWGWQEQNSWTSPYYYASVRGRPHVLNSALCFVCSLVVCNVKAPESQLRKVLFHRICTVFCFSLLLLPVKRLKCEASFLTQRMQCYRKPGFDVGSFYSIETLWSFSRHPGKANTVSFGSDQGCQPIGIQNTMCCYQGQPVCPNS